MAQARRGRPEMTKRQQIYYELYMRNCSQDLHDYIADRVLGYFDKLIYDRFQAVYPRIRGRYRHEYGMIWAYVTRVLAQICQDLRSEIQEFLTGEEGP